MSAGPDTTSAIPARSPEQTLRRLFLTLFLRGHSSRSLQKDSAPKSIASKLALTLAFYSLFGMFALLFRQEPVFALSIYLHAMTFVCLGMFITVSAGEVLFNKEEADILMHRPVTSRSLLWAKISVLIQVSLWIAGALNLAGLFVGLGAADGGWRFPVVHLFSTALEALFCTGCVVLVYQLCLRWFGRERLDGLMTTAQVTISVLFILASQLVPQLIERYGNRISMDALPWWVRLLPPAWFAGLDDTLGGSARPGSWVLASIGLAATGAVLWLAFGKLAGDYQAGLQTLSEAPVIRPRGGRRKGIEVLVRIPPFRWWLRDSVVRASFLLSAAYLVRDRDVKLRIYPGLAPMIVMPVVFFFRGPGGDTAGAFGLAFTGMYIGLIPLMAINMLQYSQQWQAADLFRAAPIAGPSRLCDGTRGAVLCFLCLPTLVLLGAVAWLIGGSFAHIALLLPGIIALPVYAMIPCLEGNAVPFSRPTEMTKATDHILTMFVVMLIAAFVALFAAFAWRHGWFHWLLLSEAVVAAGVYWWMRQSLRGLRWAPVD